MIALMVELPKFMPIHTPQTPRQAEASRANQIDVIKQERSELMSQLTSLTIRRDLISQQLRNATGQAAADLQAQLRAIDQRVKETSADMDRLDASVHRAVIAGVPDAPAVPSGLGPSDIARVIRDAISSTTTTTSSTETRLDNLQRVVIGLGAVNGLGVMLMLVVLWRTMRWPRSADGRLPGEDSARLDQLQRSVDVIALEVERISESQRFVAKLANGDKAIEGVPAGSSQRQV